MALTEQDIQALRMLMREEIDAQLSPLREEFTEFRNEVAQNFDGVYRRLETFEQEYLSMREQLKRTDDHEERISALEKKVA